MDYMPSKNTQDVICAVIGVGTGVAVWETQSTAGFAQFNTSGYSLFSQQRFGDAIASTFGNGAAKAIFPTWSGAANFNLKPSGVLNKYTVVGAGGLFASWLLDDLKHFEKIKPYLDAFFSGMLGGGIVGGLFDPDAFTLGSPGGTSIAGLSPSSTVGPSYGVTTAQLNSRTR